MHIRPYTDRDLAAVLDAWETATRLAHPFMTDAFIARERQNVAAIYLPNTQTWVATVDGDVKGFIALMGNEIGAIFLQPDYHGRGIGRALMDKAKTLHRELEVEVFRENMIGRRFYEACGFEPIAEKRHEPTGEVLLRLRFAVQP